MLETLDQIKLLISYDNTLKLPRPDSEAIAVIFGARRGQRLVLLQLHSFFSFLSFFFLVAQLVIPNRQQQVGGLPREAGHHSS